MSSREFAALEKAHRRLAQLYEIQKLLASFESVEETFDPALTIAARTLPLGSAILIETEGSRSRMIVWPSEGQDSEQIRPAKENVQAAYGYLTGAPPAGPLQLVEQAGATTLPRQAGAGAGAARRFIVIPLVVARRPPFGALQLEGAGPLDEADLMFVNAVANTLAIALDRDRARRQDVTRREHAEQERTRFEALAADNARLHAQAQQAVRLREQVLAIVSHDLRNYVGTILLAAGILGKSEVPEEQRPALAKSVARVQRAVKRMLHLIEDLLDFASIEAGRLSITRQPQEPGPIVHEALASLESLAQEKRIALTSEVEPHLPMAHCDRDRILQVLSNLAANALNATPAGGHVTLRVGAREHELLFAVSDDGPGINAEDKEHLFEGYWRGGEVRYKGTGLGLAIARGIVETSGGRIWVESEPGRGATFLFTVPLNGGGGRAPSPPRATSSAAR